jgi:hypothetical protein
MEAPTRHESPPSSVRMARRLISVALAIPGISELVTAYESAVTSLENRYNDWLRARHANMTALHQQREALTALKGEFRGFGMVILKVSRGRRNAELYRDYFPQGYGATLRFNPERALQFAAALLNALETETNPEILAPRDRLSAARSGLEAAFAARRATADALAEARLTLEEEKTTWRKAHDVFYFGVRTSFPDGRKLAESLFSMNDRRKADPAPGLPVAAAVTQVVVPNTQNAAADVAAAPAEQAA